MESKRVAREGQNSSHGKGGRQKDHSDTHVSACRKEPKEKDFKKRDKEL